MAARRGEGALGRVVEAEGAPGNGPIALTKTLHRRPPVWKFEGKATVDGKLVTEAVFTAICRKNMGCDHFIVGRDHTGVTDFYNDHETRDLFESLDDLGINPIFFEPLGFNPSADRYEVLSAPDTEAISGTQLRNALLDGDPLPDWFVRDEVQTMLRDQIANNRPVFWQPEAEVAAVH